MGICLSRRDAFIETDVSFRYEQFSKGSFSIKTNEGKLVAVGGDQKLEQTINLASAKCNSAIYDSKNKNLVAK